ncbi:MAG TPA: aldehyde dehydrogenase family protein [Steroidobacter sp.]
MSAARALPSLAGEVREILGFFGVDTGSFAEAGAGALPARSPLNGEIVAHVRAHSVAEAGAAIASAQAAFFEWRFVPAPRRGELVRLLAQELRDAKPQLGRLVSLETGKILSEGLGEVQEMIDICDFAVGLSRQLYGLTIASERPEHRMMETWHPLGVCGVITAFNFPVAVWAWNAAIALVCGNSVVWKPSEKTPLTALAVHALMKRVMKQFGAQAPQGLCGLVIGGREIGEALVNDARVPLVSATGSSAMGKQVGPMLAKRFARAILELGGNNAAIVSGSADLQLALRAIAFAALGTAGQRCTTLRRLFVHSSVYDALVPKLKRVFESVAIGNPLAPSTLVGPLIDAAAYRGFTQALNEAREAGGKVTGGERILREYGDDAYYVRPALVEMPAQIGPMLRETFAPILYVIRYDGLDAAVALNNAVSAGLSSSIFTLDMREAERFISVGGSDCGVVNVNIGPSGAEIGGAFGGEKETGGGREAGSDAWRGYMRRATNTINYGTSLPLAQGVTFPVDD